MRRSPTAAPLHQPPPPSKGRSPQLRPCTGKGASAGAGPLHCATRPAAGPARAPPPPPPAPPPQSHTTKPPPTTTRPEEMRTSCHQQMAPPPCDVAKMSPRIISIGPEPVLAAHAPSHLQRAATARREKVHLCIREQSSFYCKVPGSSREGPSPALGGLQIPRWLGSDPLSAWWLGLAPATLEFGFDSQTRGTRENRRTLCESTGFLTGPTPLPHTALS